MRIVGFAGAILLDNLYDLFPVPYNYVRNSSTNSEVPSNLGDDLRAGEPWKANDGQFLVIKQKVLV